jgi:hypothetical protein
MICAATLPAIRPGFFEVERAGWIQNIIDKDVAAVAVGLKV